MYFRDNTPIDKFFNEIIHEGTHAIDRIDLLMNNYDELFKRTKNVFLKERALKNILKT